LDHRFNGVTDHITNKYNHLLDFKKISPLSQIFVANGKSAPIFRQREIKLLFQTITSLALYVPSFPFKLLSVVLNELEFIRSNADHSLFIHIKSDEKLVVLIYVDDLIFTGNNHAAITNCKSILHQQFAIKDHGVLKYFFGIKMDTSHIGLFFNQSKNILGLLREDHMLECKLTKTHLDSILQLTLDGESFNQP
jgi:hypothetical protein